jgi:hypothetical protein
MQVHHGMSSNIFDKQLDSWYVNFSCNLVKVVSTNDMGPDNETFCLTYFLSMCFVSKDLRGKFFCFLDLSLVVCHL